MSFFKKKVSDPTPPTLYKTFHYHEALGTLKVAKVLLPGQTVKIGFEDCGCETCKEVQAYMNTHGAAGFVTGEARDDL